MMDAPTWTLIYYLCAAPAPNAAALACEPHQITAATCTAATSHVAAGTTEGRRYFPVGCVVTLPLPSPASPSHPRRPAR